MRIKDRVREYIEKEEITQREFGDKVNMTEVAVSRLVTSGRLPQLPILQNIAVTLGTTVGDLLVEEDWEKGDSEVKGETEEMMAPKEYKTQADIEYENSKLWFRTETYRDGKCMTVSMNTTKTLGFNTWAFLESPSGFDEVRIRLATQEEIEDWFMGERREA